VTKVGKHKGFGFLEFEEIEDASAALDNMNLSELNGKVITVTVARPAADTLNRTKPSSILIFFDSCTQEI
jgi:RNA recognition motif-containing protein